MQGQNCASLASRSSYSFNTHISLSYKAVRIKGCRTCRHVLSQNRSILIPVQENVTYGTNGVQDILLGRTWVPGNNTGLWIPIQVDSNALFRHNY